MVCPSPEGGILLGMKKPKTKAHAKRPTLGTDPAPAAIEYEEQYVARAQVRRRLTEAELTAALADPKSGLTELEGMGGAIIRMRKPG